MSQLVLTAEQAQIWAAAREPVEVRDPQGMVVGRLEPPITEELLRELKARKAFNQPRISSQRVQEIMHELELEWERTGGFDRLHMQQFLKTLLPKV